MMALIFLLMLIAHVFAFMNKRTIAINIYIITMITAVFWFNHHATSTIGLAL